MSFYKPWKLLSANFRTLGRKPSFVYIGRAIIRREDLYNDHPFHPAFYFKAMTADLNLLITDVDTYKPPDTKLSKLYDRKDVKVVSLQEYVEKEKERIIECFDSTAKLMFQHAEPDTIPDIVQEEAISTVVEMWKPVKSVAQYWPLEFMTDDDFVKLRKTLAHAATCCPEKTHWSFHGVVSEEKDSSYTLGWKKMFPSV